MCAAKNRIELQIDVFDEIEQQALARADLTPSELIKAILTEFHYVEFLSQDADDYQLVRADNGEELNPAREIGGQLDDNDRLMLREKQRPLPPNTVRPPRALYLRDGSEDRVYRIDWLPAIIGRFDKNLPHNELIAVNLEAAVTGLRVSRRHIRLDLADGAYYAENLSNNPATLIRDGMRKALNRGQTSAIQNGDVIRLDRSEISLNILIREPVNADLSVGENGDEGDQSEAGDLAPQE